MSEELVPHEVIENRIYMVRGQKVILDNDLASLYRVPTFRLNEQVKRNLDRFPNDFMFQLTKEEYENLTSQIAISSWGGRRSLPLAFTEHGVAMLATILRSERAIKMSIYIIKAFVRLRQVLASHKDLAAKIDLLEKRVFKHDSDIRGLVRDIRRLSLPKLTKDKEIGFLH